MGEQLQIPMQVETCKPIDESTYKEPKVKKPNKNRVYYLHSVIKKQGFEYSSSQKTVFVEEITANRFVIELRDKFGYSIQLVI